METSSELVKGQFQIFINLQSRKTQIIGPSTSRSSWLPQDPLNKNFDGAAYGADLPGVATANDGSSVPIASTGGIKLSDTSNDSVSVQNLYHAQKTKPLHSHELLIKL